MPRAAKPLSDVAIRAAIAKAEGRALAGRDFPLWDGQGLHLIARSGGYHWRWKYHRPDGRENRLALGHWPAVGLRDARTLALAARAALYSGTDPGEQRAAQRAAQRRSVDATFKHFGEMWLKVKGPGWSPKTVQKHEMILRDYLNPKLGKVDVGTLTSGDVLAVLRDMAADVPDLAVKAATVARGIVRLAISERKREDGKLLDLDLRHNLPKRTKGHNPAATTPREVAKVMDTVRAIEDPIVRAALLVCAYTAQRPGNVAAMQWADVDLRRAEWHIPAEVMKMREAHIVPLSTQAVELIKAMKPLSGRGVFVFPPIAKRKTPHLHRDTLSKALRDAGLRGKQTPHGLRATLRTVARERLGIHADILEAQIAHAKRGDVQSAYDRAGFITERHQLAQTWADYLDGAPA